MKQENIDFLEANRHYHDILIQAGIVKHLDGATKQRIFEIIREEFAPNYMVSLWCSSCVADLLKFAYTQFDKYLAENPKSDLLVFEPKYQIGTQVMYERESAKDIAIDQLNAKQTKRKRRNQSK